jgi:3-isopropylmalate/(R)-2-methylmalate dehydratase small subunit
VEKLITHEGLVAPMPRANVDTDAIIPKQFLTAISRTGFGPNLFDEWRYLDPGKPGQDCARRPLNPDFELNAPRYAGASILLTRNNFGCGSSREHAVWALYEYGFRVIVAPDFGEIFYQNALKNGLLLVRLTEREVDELFGYCSGPQPKHLIVDLPAQAVKAPDGKLVFSFDIDPSRKHRLTAGLDEIGVTLSKEETIRRFEEQHVRAYPWLASAG